MNTKIKVIVTGASGMVGEGVLLECLENDNVESVLVVGRRACGVVHPKMKEIIHKDLYNLSVLEEQLSGYDACYFCLGTTSVGKSEEDYYKVTYTLTMHFADTLSKLNPGMTFCYVSGAGTDSTEKGKLNWARVKGKTENDLMKLPFRQVYAFRPAFLQATKGQKNTLGLYKLLGSLSPVVRALFPKFVSSLQELGRAMICVTLNGYEKQIIEVTDILKLAHNK